MSHKSALRGLAAVAVLALVAAACSSDNGGGGDESPTGGPVEKINVTVYGQGAWTGGFSSLVLPSMQGAQIHFDELNADPDYPANITFKKADTQGSSTQAPPVVRDVVSDPETVAVVGPAFSGESDVSGDTYNENKIPFVTASATSVTLAKHHWDYWYRAVGNDDAQGRLSADLVAQVVKPKVLFVLHDKSTYGQPLAETVAKTAEEAGIKVAKVEGTPQSALTTGSTVNFSAVISDVKASNPDTVFFGGYFPDSGPFLKQAKDAGVDFTLVSGDGSVSSEFVSLAGADNAEGSYLVAPSNIDQDFVQKYNQEEGTNALSVAVYSGEGYDVAGLIGEGVKQAIEGGATEPEDIRAGIKDYLDSLTGGEVYHGVAKDIAFEANTHEMSTQEDDLYYFYRIENGTVKNLGNASTVLG